jgi:hypothetical protein
MRVGTSPCTSAVRQSRCPILRHYSEGVATLHGTAAVAIDEFRIERRLAELGYPEAEQTVAQALHDQLFSLSCEVFEAPVGRRIIRCANLRLRSPPIDAAGDSHFGLSCRPGHRR